MHSVTKAVPIHFTDGKRDIKFSQLHSIMLLVINILGSAHTQADRQTHKAHTCIPTPWIKTIPRNQAHLL